MFAIGLGEILLVVVGYSDKTGANVHQIEFSHSAYQDDGIALTAASHIQKE